MSKISYSGNDPENQSENGSEDSIQARERLLARFQAAAGALPRSPEAARCFEDDGRVSDLDVLNRLRSYLKEYRASTDRNVLKNPTRFLAVEIIRLLESGEISIGVVETLIQRLVAEAFVCRAARHRRYVGEMDRAANDARIVDLVRAVALGPDPDGTPVPFEAFQSRVESELFGIVITAHPTFSLSSRLIRALGAVIAGEDSTGHKLDEGELDALFQEVAALEHRSDQPIDLKTEQDLSLEAICNIQNGLRRVYEHVFAVARDLYPNRWQDLCPRLLTVASWVGYDLDGRSDITWTATLHTRLRVQLRQLETYLDYVRDIHQQARERPAGDRSDSAELVQTLELVESRLALAIKEIKDEMNVFGAAEAAADYAQIQRIAKQMREGLSLRLVESGHLVELISKGILAAQDDDLIGRLCILRAELANYGLAMAHTHVRLNATQLHNAINSEIGLTAAPDDPAFRRSYLAAINDLLDKVQPVTINFGTIIAERASARRLFMVVTQLIKYVDSTTPVRFLIAESDTTLTVLIALYFAKLFDIEDRIDISPLFETEKGLERGVRIMRDLLANEHYRAYVKRRGRLCIQTGFSDAGRLLGQTTAAAGMERLKLGLTELLAEEGLKDVQLVVFDTHGEAVGRGGHPGDFGARLDYIMTPESRWRADGAGIALKQEISFQGGDGYVHFITPDLAYASICRILERALPRPVPAEPPDPFYEEWDYVVEFFATINQFNRGLMQDPNFAALLGMFGTNLLYPAGSRSLTRQSDDPLAPGREVTHPMQLRAISHNSILQQMGFLANSVGGVGRAIAKDPDGFRSLYQASPRFRLILSMARWGLVFSDIDALKSYINLTDPELWLARSVSIGDSERFSEVMTVAENLEELDVHVPLNAVFRNLHRDVIEFDRFMARAMDDGDGQVAAPAERASSLFPEEDPDLRDRLVILHALRVALIRQIYVIATRIPEFSVQHGTTPKSLIRMIAHLDIERAMNLLEKIFPPDQNLSLLEDFGEPATYRSTTTRGYETQHGQIFVPMAKHYALVRRISTGIISLIGATG